jgi:hypothetical protein
MNPEMYFRDVDRIASEQIGGERLEMPFRRSTLAMRATVVTPDIFTGAAFVRLHSLPTQIRKETSIVGRARTPAYRAALARGGRVGQISTGIDSIPHAPLPPKSAGFGSFLKTCNFPQRFSACHLERSPVMG